MRIKRDDAPSERAGGNFFLCCKNLYVEIL